jgi:hypothetical protein
MGNMFCKLDKYCEGKYFELRNTHQTSQQGLLFHFEDATMSSVCEVRRLSSVSC